MEKQNYSISFSLDAMVEEAFEANNSVTKWWTEDLEGNTRNLNDECTSVLERCMCRNKN